jgi:hypothetical protein
MSTEVERQAIIELAVRLARECAPTIPTGRLVAYCGQLLALGHNLHVWAERECNGELSDRMLHLQQIHEANARAVCAELGLECRIGGDPRGYVLAVVLPSGESNSWGGEIWGIA